MNHETIPQPDQLLGYSLIRKIGSGGYGDVWEAHAPGGLKKAVKIIHGYHDEKRAQAELKALDRIKEARHPFLLSLERIEVCQSKLVIISEMADRCLSDVANEYSQQGEAGIPRDELLRYMNEAADALDYLHDAFALQHLDIKPENILMVSGHAKIADFGLVKDLRDVSQSMMSGMTPTYASPELFDGRPGPASDQYSLAIVYQEMLTMTRPFPGSTAAQLAAQHMHGKPDLRSLPISDQAIVAKALAKEPADRFKSCRQFVEQLCNRKTRKRVVKSRTTTRQAVETSDKTVAFPAAGFPESKISTSRLHSFTGIDLNSLTPPDCDPQSAVFQPTLVIGVGRSSSLVLQNVKQRLIARHGDTNSIPAFRLLCIDSDRDSLAQLSVGGGVGSLRVSETLAIPLRRSEQYRQRANLDLSWISRRWIYNVPRSLQTEGLRPLGRVAFVDHFDAICDSISKSLSQAVMAEHIGISCETLALDLPIEVRPRVIVVTNIAGGLGSGLTNDLAYTIRLMAAEQGIKQIDLIGMLLYGCEAGREASLAAANAYAFLSEMRHFADGGYPGDRRIGIPEFDDDLPFDFLYALKFRSEKQQASFAESDKLAEYICLSTTTRCSVFFDATRQKEKQQDELYFRSLGTSICGPGLQVQGRDAVERLSKNLIDLWIAKQPDPNFSAEQFARSCVKELHIELDAITTKTLAQIAELDEWKVAQAEIAALPDQLVEIDDLTFRQIDERFDTIFDKPRWRSESQAFATRLCLAAENEINQDGHFVGDQLSRRILDLLNEDRICFQGIEQALDACRQAITKEHDGVLNGLHRYGHTLQEMRQLYEQRDVSRRREFRLSFIQQFSQLRTQEFSLRCCNDVYRVIKSCLLSTAEIIKTFRAQLGLVSQSFQAAPLPKRTTKYRPTIQELVIDSVEREYDQLLPQIERIVLDAIRADGGQFLEVLSESLNWQQRLPALIKEASQSVLSAAFRKISIDDVVAKNNVQPEVLRSWLSQQLIDATPLVNNCGGRATLLLGQPLLTKKSVLPEIITESFQVELQEIRGTTGDLVFCFEAEGIPLANVAFSVLKDAPEATELAKRIGSRSDIDWTSLDDLM